MSDTKLMPNDPKYGQDILGFCWWAWLEVSTKHGLFFDSKSVDFNNKKKFVSYNCRAWICARHVYDMGQI